MLGSSASVGRLSYCFEFPGQKVIRNSEMSRFPVPKVAARPEPGAEVGAFSGAEAMVVPELAG
jgi:hypothetical protein